MKKQTKKNTPAKKNEVAVIERTSIRKKNPGGRPITIDPNEIIPAFESWKLSLINEGIPVKKVSAGQVISYNMPAPPTHEGFYHYLGITKDTYYRYVNKELGDIEGVEIEKKQKISYILSRVWEWIDARQKAGAIAGEYNGGFTAKLLGLVDKQEISGNIASTVNYSIGGNKIDAEDII